MISLDALWVWYYNDLVFERNAKEMSLAASLCVVFTAGDTVRRSVMDSRQNQTTGVIWKQILYFFFPILLGTFFQQLYNTADAMIVGNFLGKEALSAVGGTTGTLINLLVGFFVGLSSGASVVISQYYGAGRPKQVSRAVHTAVALAIAGGVILMALGLLAAPAALGWMHTPGDVMPYSLVYIRVYFLGVVGNLIYNMGAAILRAVGDSRRPLYFLIASCFVNIVLDFLFVAGLRWGVFGAALATILSQLTSAVLVMLVLMRSEESYRIYLKKIRLDVAILRHVFRIGLPAGFQSAMYSLSNIIIQSSVNSFGTDTVAAWAAYGKIDGLFWMTVGAFGISITTFVGQNYGAREYGRIRRGMKQCLAMAMGVAVCMSTVLYCFGGRVYLLFIDDPTVIARGQEILRFLVPTFFTYVSIEILSGTLRGIGDSIIPMLLTCGGVCLLRVVWIVIMVPLFPRLETVMVSYPLSWVITSFLFVLYYNCFSRMRHLPKERSAA